MKRVLYKVVFALARRARFLERLGLAFDEAFALVLSGAKRQAPKVFNLDLHVSVNADLSKPLSEFAQIKTWSLSGHNRVRRRFRVFSDPVRYVNNRTWTKLDHSMIEKFSQRYNFFLRSFSGFLVTYPISFALLFQKFGKPILAVVAVRYEAPFTYSRTRREWLNNTLREMLARKQLILVANNRGDADYFLENVGVEIPVVHSVCDYVAEREQVGPSGTAIPVAYVWLNGRASEFLPQVTGETIPSLAEALGDNYAFSDLQRLGSVVFIPYTNSIMRLFEFAYLGIPVFIPSDEFLLELVQEEMPGVLDQLSFVGIVPGEDGGELPKLSDWRNPETLKWWLDRSDFNDSDLMPNVIRFRSWQDLQALLENPPAALSREVLDRRNARLISQRSALAEQFVTAMQGGSLS